MYISGEGGTGTGTGRPSVPKDCTQRRETVEAIGLMESRTPEKTKEIKQIHTYLNACMHACMRQKQNRKHTTQGRSNATLTSAQIPPYTPQNQTVKEDTTLDKTGKRTQRHLTPFHGHGVEETSLTHTT